MSSETFTDSVDSTSELIVYGGRFTVRSAIRISLQVSETSVLCTAALVDLNEAPVYAVTYAEKYLTTDRLSEEIIKVPGKAVDQLMSSLSDNGILLIKGESDGEN